MRSKRAKLLRKQSLNRTEYKWLKRQWIQRDRRVGFTLITKDSIRN